MRVRLWAVIALTLLLAAATACTDSRVSRGPATTPAPTKTLRPTFTNTPVKPTLTPSPTVEAPAPAEAPAAGAPTEAPPTPEPAAPAPAPTEAPPQAAFTVTSATLNVRSGPGTNYGVIGQVRQGQTFPITGKNPAGNWWQFDYNGRAGWVSGELARATGADSVQVAENIPAAPTAAPRPTAAPARPAPTQPPAPPPAPATRYGVLSTTMMENTNDIVTVYCLLLNKNKDTVLGGTIRVSRDGATQERPFPAQGSFFLQFPINDSCKVEISPAVNGTYTAVLIDGGQPVSDPFSFTVSGNSNRTAIIGWVQK